MSFCCLSFLDEAGQLQLSIDASDSAAGAVLEQVKDGVTTPVAFHSNKLVNPTENHGSLDEPHQPSVLSSYRSRSKLVSPKNTQLQPGFISKSVIKKNTLHQFSRTTQTKNLQQRNSDTKQATIRFRFRTMTTLGDRKMHNKRLRGHGNN